MKKRFKISQDDWAQDPRAEWDNLGTMICFHRGYNLGDKHDYSHDDFDGWDDIQNYIEKKLGGVVILPLYLYDHSGITMNTTGFSCPWDSGQVGFIYVSRETLLKEYGGKKVTTKLKERVTQYLIGEVETYDQYLTGDVYRYDIEVAEEQVIIPKDDFDKGIYKPTQTTLAWEFEDSCSGFYGSDIGNGIGDYADVPKEVLEEALDNIGEWIEFEITKIEL
jgi:hypothetical protein